METKSKYTSPTIELIQLDNEISLALQSAPPEGPEEGHNGLTTPDYFRNNPTNSDLA